MANAVPVSKPLVTDPDTFSSPLDSVTVRLPFEGLKPLPAGQLIVNVPLKVWTRATGLLACRPRGLSVPELDQAFRQTTIC
jgi:hypothetical protein